MAKTIIAPKKTKVPYKTSLTDSKKSIDRRMYEQESALKGLTEQLQTLIALVTSPKTKVFVINQKRGKAFPVRIQLPPLKMTEQQFASDEEVVDLGESTPVMDTGYIEVDTGVVTREIESIPVASITVSNMKPVVRAETKTIQPKGTYENGQFNVVKKLVLKNDKLWKPPVMALNEVFDWGHTNLKGKTIFGMLQAEPHFLAQTYVDGWFKSADKGFEDILNFNLIVHDTRRISQATTSA